MSTGEIKQLTAGLVSLQKEFALNPQKLMQDYDYFAKNFAYTTDRLATTTCNYKKCLEQWVVQKLAQSLVRIWTLLRGLLKWQVDSIRYLVSQCSTVLTYSIRQKRKEPSHKARYS